MSGKIPKLILKYEKTEKERLKKNSKINNTQNKNSNYSYIYFVFLYNKNKVVEIRTNNFDAFKGEIIELKIYPTNNKLKGVILINVTNTTKCCTYKKLYIPLSYISTCIPVVDNTNTKEQKDISNAILNSYKSLLVNEIYEKFKKIGG
ncbi:hypothetical protein YYC_04439 [Plasmodium yoelii 17X]|uniref:Uncharacterized protein n=1 Tax=Plasmodium yoelii 17X TaxID=1323249 RepID=V7PEZ2_PLAYE|nr:hypothetical protein YYC_04439 [Plasmodium yoelii 17X]